MVLASVMSISAVAVVTVAGCSRYRPDDLSLTCVASARLTSLVARALTPVAAPSGVLSVEFWSFGSSLISSGGYDCILPLGQASSIAVSALPRAEFYSMVSVVMFAGLSPPVWMPFLIGASTPMNGFSMSVEVSLPSGLAELMVAIVASPILMRFSGMF